MAKASETFPNKRPCILLALGWYSSAIHRGIARYARKANWILDAGMARNGRIPSSRQFDGVISLLSDDLPLLEFVRSCRKPVVNIGDVQVPGIHTVHCDDEAIGQMAAKHFISRGFRHAAFFLGSESASSNKRMRAFEKAMTHSGASFHKIDASLLRSSKLDPSIDEHELTSRLGDTLMQLPRPLSVFSEYDEVAIEVLYACHKMGIPVPEQVAVLGVDNDPLFCDFAPVPLSSIDNNQEAEGYHAAALLDQFLQGKKNVAGKTSIAPLGVATRLSTDILAVDNPHVATALHHIWQNFTKPINAKTVAATVPITYRRLHDAFQESLGRTIAEEITLKRLEKAQQLLLDTQLRAHEIAERSGFSSEDRMGRVFRRILNQSPLEFRKTESIRQNT
ncbi:AraC family transcriptional regulator [Coraliomargarita parva]|uniref:AraC family transcriptional regulator n=1 Tax=Coraliomargarita parva TaxID=3014050 RepID=UPI0022B40A0E|nr:DNA-binding transcriptional regulator [Coraliomargarita parva]